MTRLTLSFAALLLAFGASIGPASAGLLRHGAVPHETIHVKRVMATYRALGPPNEGSYELSLKGLAVTMNGSMGAITRGTLSIAVNIDPDGNFDSSEKGAFEIRKGNTVFLKGSITEAHTAAFAQNGYLEFLATEDIEGMYADRFDKKIGFKIDLRADNLDGQGFAFQREAGKGLYGFDYIMERVVGSADIGRPVPEPTSSAAFATTLLIGLAGLRSRRKSKAVASRE